MGSFAAAVDLAERLRPWSLAGLSHLYLPDGLEESVPEAMGEHLCGCSPAALEDAVAAPRVAATAAPGPASVPSAHLSDAVHVEGPAPVWPAPWDALAARVRTEPKVIITYSALADDVTGKADPARRKLFQTILAYLAWPQGTSLFWPVSFPTGADAQGMFAVDVFAQGVRHFRIRHVVCFGPGPAQRVRTLFPPEDKEVLVHEALAPEALAPLLPHELHQALAHLKALRVD